jgi:hypothetical protein
LTNSTLRLAVHASSGSAANLARTGAATLLRAEPGTIETRALRVRPLGVATVDGTELVKLGIAFAPHDECAVRGRWDRTRTLLRTAAPA